MTPPSPLPFPPHSSFPPLPPTLPPSLPPFVPHLHVHSLRDILLAFIPRRSGRPLGWFTSCFIPWLLSNVEPTYFYSHMTPLASSLPTFLSFPPPSPPLSSSFSRGSELAHSADLVDCLRSVRQQREAESLCFKFHFDSPPPNHHSFTSLFSSSFSRILTSLCAPWTLAFHLGWGTTRQQIRSIRYVRECQVEGSPEHRVRLTRLYRPSQQKTFLGSSNQIPMQ